MAKNRSGKAKEPKRGCFFLLRKLVKAMMEKIENLKSADRV